MTLQTVWLPNHGWSFPAKVASSIFFVSVFYFFSVLSPPLVSVPLLSKGLPTEKLFGEIFHKVPFPFPDQLFFSVFT